MLICPATYHAVAIYGFQITDQTRFSRCHNFKVDGQNAPTVKRHDVRMVYPENMMQLACIVSKLNNEPHNIFNAKVIISRSKVKMTLQYTILSP